METRQQILNSINDNSIIKEYHDHIYPNIFDYIRCWKNIKRDKYKKLYETGKKYLRKKLDVVYLFNLFIYMEKLMDKNQIQNSLTAYEELELIL